MRRSAKSVANNNLNLSILEFIKKGFNPSKISRLTNLSKTTIQYHISQLKTKGIIQKLGYGTWEIIKTPEKRSAKSVVIGYDSGGDIRTSLSPDSVRGHAFMFRLDLPGDFRNWDRREERLVSKGVKFQDYFVGGIKRGQQFVFRDWTVQFTDRSVILQTKASFLSETAAEAKETVISKVLGVVRQLEAFLGANFSYGSKYRFRVSRQHYSLVKNALAKQYDKEGKKLQVFNDSGLWFVIDNSFNLHEVETLHPETAPDDNKKVQDFFNGIKKFEGFTPEFVVNALGQNAANLDAYAVHLKAHVESVKQLGAGVTEFTKQTNRLFIKQNKAISELTKAVKELKK